MKKFNKLSLLALLGLVLTACGPTSSPTDPTSNPEPTNPTTEPGPTDTGTTVPSFVAPESISLIGSIGDGADWNTDYDLVSSDEGHTWVIENFKMNKDEEWKVRMNHNWGTAGVDNWGYSYLDDASKALFSGSDNIIVTTAGEYKVTFNYDDMVISAEITKEGIKHRDAFVSELPEGAITRNYNEEFDLMLDDNSAAESTAITQGTAKYNNKPALRVLVDNEADGFPGTPDASIYKMATGVTEIETYEGIGFKMRIVGNGTIDYSNLVLALRGNDAWNTYAISLDTAVNPDGDPLPELTNEFQEITICPNLTIEDGDTEYTLSGTEDPSGTKVLSEILGFHLYAKGECSAIIEIQEVYVTNPGDVKVLDNFARKEVSKTDDTCWWRDSTGFIMQTNTTIVTDGFYMPGTPAFYKEWENIVFNVQGSTYGTGLYFFDASGNLVNNTPWWDLKDPAGAAVANAVEGAFYPIVVNFENSGIDVTNVVAVSVGSISELAISQVFLSNLQDVAAAEEYPRIDTFGNQFFDTFDRNVTHIAGSYEEGNAEVDSTIANAGLYYSIAYSHPELTSVDGEALVLAPCPDGYIQVTEGSTVARNGAKYIVFVMKTEGEGTLDDFRISSSTGGVKYLNQWVAGPGLPSIPADHNSYPYIDAEGYTHYIMDIEASEWDVADALDIYYTGTATVKISAIYFADDYVQTSTYNPGADLTAVPVDAYEYRYGGYLTADTIEYGMVIAGDGVVTLETLRLEFNGETIWANNGLVIYDENYATRDYRTPVSTEGEIIIIDLVASGFDTSVANQLHIHWGGLAEAPKGTITVTQVVALGVVTYPMVPIDVSKKTADFTGGYAWGGQTMILGEEIALVVTITGDGNATLETLRVEYNSKVVWLKDTNFAIDLATGQPADLTAPIPTTGGTYMLNLLVAGFDMGVMGYLHYHWGGEPTGQGIATISTVIGVYMAMPYFFLIGAYSDNAR